MNRTAKIFLSALVGTAAVAAAATSANAEFTPRSERGQWIMMLQEQQNLNRRVGLAQPRAQRQSSQRGLRFTSRPRTYARGVLPAATAPRYMDPQFLPTVVDYNGRHAPGTIVIDTNNKFLYLVESGSKARRYGVGVGRPGFQWAGTHRISQKREWPGWTPPSQMRKRQPELPAFMPGGPDNPLGARALYLGSTLYRIHGSRESRTIGQDVSSGCFRMTNTDVIDLYKRAKVGAKVVVL